MMHEYRPCTICKKNNVRAILDYETMTRTVQCEACGYMFATLPPISLSNLATIGIEALIDEVAGFQQVRGKDALLNRISELEGS